MTNYSDFAALLISPYLMHKNEGERLKNPTNAVDYLITRDRSCPHRIRHGTFTAGQTVPTTFPTRVGDSRVESCDFAPSRRASLKETDRLISPVKSMRQVQFAKHSAPLWRPVVLSSESKHGQEDGRQMTLCFHWQAVGIGPN